MSSAARLAGILLLLAVALPSSRTEADPGDSLTGADLLAERRDRRRRVAESIEEGALLLVASPEPGLRPYRQEPDYLYLTGVDEPGGALLLVVERPERTERSRAAGRLARRLEDLAWEAHDLARRARRAKAEDLAAAALAEERGLRESLAELDRLVRSGLGPARIAERLYLPAPAPGRGRWEGPRLPPGPEAAEVTGIRDVRDLSRLAEDLIADAPPGGSLHRPRDEDVPAAFDAVLRRIGAERPDLRTASARAAIAPFRGVKSPEEVARIRRACEITCAGLREAMRSCRPGMHEYELTAVLEYACRRAGAPRQAFPSIVGSGPNSTVLHYRANLRRIEAGDVVLMDVGAELMGYAADVTRTFPAGGRFGEGQAEIYEIVLRAQEAAILAVRPGARMGDVDRAARTVIGGAGFGKAFLHGTSHHVGLDVHDPTPVGPLRPGMVLTVEPGIYLPERGLGIRIEDTVLVTEDGREVLSAGAPKSRREIEAIMRQKGIGNLPIR